MYLIKIQKIEILLSVLFEEDLGPLIAVGPGAAAPPAPMVVTPLFKQDIIH